jgi:hypothetical protein
LGFRADEQRQLEEDENEQEEKGVSVWSGGHRKWGVFWESSAREQNNTKVRVVQSRGNRSCPSTGMGQSQGDGFLFF